MRKKKPTALDRKEMKKLLGAAPVLSSEYLKDYDAILMRLMDCIDPDDVIELFYVKDLADQIWEINRLRLHKVLVMERAHQRHQEKEEERRRQSRRRNTAIDERVKELFKAEQAGPAGEPTQAGQVEQASARTTQLDRKLELEEVIDSTVDEVDDILLDPADEVDHARALQSDIDYFERLDDLLGVAIARRDDVLAQLDFYRQGLGQRLRQVSDEIIDAEFKETAPSITGPDGDEQ